MVYFRLSTSGLTTGPPSSYTQPQSGLKPRHQAKQGSASLNAVSVSEGVGSGVQNCDVLLSSYSINFSYTGTVWYIWMTTGGKVCLNLFVCVCVSLWKMSVKSTSRRWVKETIVSSEMLFPHSLIRRALWSLYCYLLGTFPNTGTTSWGSQSALDKKHSELNSVRDFWNLNYPVDEHCSALR